MNKRRSIAPQENCPTTVRRVFKVGGDERVSPLYYHYMMLSTHAVTTVPYDLSLQPMI